MGFPVPLPVCWRVFGKRNWELVEMEGVRRVSAVAILGSALARWSALPGGFSARCSGQGEAVSVGGFDDGSGRDHGAEAFVGGGGTNAAGSAWGREWARLGGVG